MQTLFDVNGRFGQGTFGPGEFPAAADLLRHMDYLGVDRALAWHYQARDLSPTAGNRTLLAELAATPGAAGRLFPAFVVTPSVRYENGALDALTGAFRDRGLKALRLFPKNSRFEMRTIERMLAAVSDFNPLVLVNFKELWGSPDGCRALAETARAFPGTNFALTELMWGDFNNAVDLMWRADNIQIDISWLHMRDTIEFLRDEFGAERILFGTGFKSHYGAAVAALNHARLSEDDRRLIASGNAERLLDLPPLARKAAVENDLLAQKPLWREFRAGRPVRGVEIIDAHAHTTPHTRGWILRDIELPENIANLAAQMDRCGVSKTVITPEGALFGDPIAANDEAERLMADRLDRFAGWLAFNPWYADRLTPELDRFFAGAFFLGFKLLASYWRVPMSDPRYRPVWTYADRHGKPILMHTWGDAAVIGEIAPACPGAKFLFGHAGGGAEGRAQAEAIAANNPNAFLEFCGSFTTPDDWLDTIARLGIGKVVFGSDTGAHDLAWELGRFLSIPLPDEALKPALAGNFKNLLTPGDRARHFPG